MDDPTFENGQNERIVERLAQPGEVDRAVGIQIVYDVEVETAVRKAEEEDKPLLIYSWLPRAEIMTDRRFVRVTLESFYHCKFPSLATQEKPVASATWSKCRLGSAIAYFPGLLGRTPAPGCFPHSTEEPLAARTPVASRMASYGIPCARAAEVSASDHPGCLRLSDRAR